jgi:type II secretion system protein J
MTMKKKNNKIVKRGHVYASRRGFTLIELIIAGVITAFVLGSISMSVAQLGRAKNTSKLRLDAFLRADAALDAVRKDVVSVIRTDDLFFTRLLLINDTIRAENEEFDRDEILVFNTRVKALRNIEFSGEGFEYETQYRVADDDWGPVLWVRNDAMPDEYPLGGGMAKPVVEGIVSISFEAYDGGQWLEQWDSDIDGLPLAIRVTITSSGHRGIDDIYTAPRAVLRTIVPIDRVISPKDLFEEEEEEEEEEEMTPEEALEEAGLEGGIPEGGFNEGGGQPRPGGAGGGEGGGRPVGRPGGGRPRPGGGGGGTGPRPPTSPSTGNTGAGAPS